MIRLENLLKSFELLFFHSDLQHMTSILFLSSYSNYFLILVKMGKDKNKRLDKLQYDKQSKNKDRETKKEYRKRSHQIKDYTLTEERIFLLELNKFGLGVKYIDGDGNCLFRSLADQLFGDTNKHMDIRNIIMNYMISEKDHFSLFIEDDEPFDDYIERMK